MARHFSKDSLKSKNASHCIQFSGWRSMAKSPHGRWRPSAFLLALAALFITYPSSSLADSHVIYWGSLADNQSSITINTGDDITWIWNGTEREGCNLVSGEFGEKDNLFGDPAIFAAPHVFSFVFRNAGRFPYFCSSKTLTSTVFVRSMSSLFNIFC